VVTCKYDNQVGEWIPKKGRNEVGRIKVVSYVYSLHLPGDRRHNIKPSEKRDQVIAGATALLQ